MAEKIYKTYCRIQEVLVGAGFLTIVILTFLNVILRKFFNAPITSADDISLLLFSWTAFIGADVALRYSRLVGMDILVSKLSPKVQKSLQITVYLIMIASFVLFAVTGFELAMSNWKRGYNTLPISYGWATLSLPVGCVMMILTAVIKVFKVIKNFKDDSYNVRKDNPDAIGEENTGAEDLV